MVSETWKDFLSWGYTRCSEKMHVFSYSEAKFRTNRSEDNLTTWPRTCWRGTRSTSPTFRKPTTSWTTSQRPPATPPSTLGDKNMIPGVWGEISGSFPTAEMIHKKSRNDESPLRWYRQNIFPAKPRIGVDITFTTRTGVWNSGRHTWR